MGLRVAELTAGRDGLAVASGLGTVGEPSRIPAAEIAGVEVKIGMQSGPAVYYDLAVVRNDGRRTTAAGGISDQREAEWLAALIRQALGA